MTTVRKKTFAEIDNHTFIKYLELAIDMKSRPEYERWSNLTDEQFAEMLFNKSTHKETYHEN